MSELPFARVEPALAGQTAGRAYPHMKVRASYDDQGRLTLARARGKVDGQRYSATLEITYEPLVGSFSTSDGDIARWENGAESSSGSYGGWEQNDTEEIAFEPWVERTLARMSF